MPSAFITGSSRGIGLEIALNLSKKGWTVAIHGRNVATVKSIAQSIGKHAIPYSFDISNTELLGKSLQAFSKEAGGLDAVVHSAGIMKDAPLGMLGSELISEVIAVNTISSLELVQFSSRIMTKFKKGSIILINSVVGLDGASGQSLYSMSKSSLSGLVRSASKELGPKGIRINEVAPGLIQTELIEGLGQEFLETQRNIIPLRRIGKTSDVSSLVEFLASDSSSYITGQTIRIDGGYSL